MYKSSLFIGVLFLSGANLNFPTAEEQKTQRQVLKEAQRLEWEVENLTKVVAAQTTTLAVTQAKLSTAKKELKEKKEELNSILSEETNQ